MKALEIKASEAYDEFVFLDTIGKGAALTICLFYLVYHLISKARGNEKNPPLNNYGLFVAVFAFVYLGYSFFVLVIFYVLPAESYVWITKHWVIYLWSYWLSQTCNLLLHANFNFRYITSTFKLPLLIKSAREQAKWIAKFFEQREEQFVMISAEELEEHKEELRKIKVKQNKQERWFTGTKFAFYLLITASWFPFVYYSWELVTNFFHVPLFIILNVAMIIAVIVMRFVIARTPELYPNEKGVVLHAVIFTVVTSLWIYERVYSKRYYDARDLLNEDYKFTNAIKYYQALTPYWRAVTYYYLASDILNIFMLLMLHQFSTFVSTVYDPVTKQHVPVISMFQTAAILEKALKDKELSDMAR